MGWFHCKVQMKHKHISKLGFFFFYYFTRSSVWFPTNITWCWYLPFCWPISPNYFKSFITILKIQQLWCHYSIEHITMILQSATSVYKNHDCLSLEVHKSCSQKCVFAFDTSCPYTSEYLTTMYSSFSGSEIEKCPILQSETQAELLPIKVKQK